MMGGVIFLAVPLAVFVSLAFLPKGRPGFIGIGIAILAAGALALTQAQAPGLRLLTLAVCLAAVLAMVAQAVRLLLDRGTATAPWVYPAVVAGLALSALVILNTLIRG